MKAPHHASRAKAEPASLPPSVLEVSQSPPAKVLEIADQTGASHDAQLILAADRTLLAMERTYAAWVRTGLAALASGVAARGFMDKVVPTTLADIVASLLIAFSGFCFVAGVWREIADVRAASPDLRRIPPFALIGANTAMSLTSLLALVGIWAA